MVVAKMFTSNLKASHGVSEAAATMSICFLSIAQTCFNEKLYWIHLLSEGHLCPLCSFWHLLLLN